MQEKIIIHRKNYIVFAATIAEISEGVNGRRFRSVDLATIRKEREKK